MNQTDHIYRAFTELKRALEENRSVLSFSRALAEAAEQDRITVTHNLCYVEEDWVAAIERGLPFIAKAIEEDRQFIRSDGEVQPIEKVRHISRESVQHLSRHSDYITREPKEDDIIPDKLYTVERLNDYAVYENRFLYLLLCKIRDFVSLRYDAILRAFKLYRGELSVRKKVALPTRRMELSVSMTDEQDDALAASADPVCLSYLGRMEKIQSSVAFFLRTPLMVEVSRVDKIKSKITKTNVLRMDKNFKEAVSLYEFLLAYEGDGYTVERNVTALDPVSAEIASELAAPSVLLSFLVYEHGLGMEELLREAYEREEALRAERAQSALVEAIKELKKRVAETGEDMERYMLLLEERNAWLEKEHLLYLEAQKKIEALEGTVGELRAERERLMGEIGELTAENEALGAKIEEMAETHRQQLAALKEEHARETAALKEEQEKELERAERKHREEIARVRAEGEKKLKEERERTAERMRETEEARRETDAVQKVLESAEEECAMLRARYTALRSEHGLRGDADFTTEEGFNELEREFEALGRLVRREWTDVKRMLRKEFYGSLRTVMRGKKGEKSAAYEALVSSAQARRAQGEEPPIGEGTKDSEEASDEDGRA